MSYNWNYIFAYYGHNMFEADLYKDSEDTLYAVIKKNVFNENEWLGTFSELEPELTKLTQEEIRELYVIIDSIPEKVIRSLDKSHLLRFFNRYQQHLLHTTLRENDLELIEEINKPKIYLVRQDGEERILLIADEEIIGNTTVDTVANLYVTLSELGLTPYVHTSAIDTYLDNQYLYLITDYIPKTLADVEDIQLKVKLLKRAMTIAYTIQGMGYTNQDLHTKNFLYDEDNDKLYAIDFTDIVYEENSVNVKPLKIYAEELDSSYTLQDIKDGLY